MGESLGDGAARPAAPERKPSPGATPGAPPRATAAHRCWPEGRPVSQVTEDFLAWACRRLAAEGKAALLLVWDNTSWHISRRVRAWIKAHKWPGQGRGRGADRRLPAAQQEPAAEPDRAQVAARPARDPGTGARAYGSR